jgi:hypothetical protein
VGWESVAQRPGMGRGRGVPASPRQAGATADARVAPSATCIIGRAVNAAGMPMAQETTQERLAANSCATAHQLRPDLVGSVLAPLSGRSLYRGCKVPPHPQRTSENHPTAPAGASRSL